MLLRGCFQALGKKISLLLGLYLASLWLPWPHCAREAPLLHHTNTTEVFPPSNKYYRSRQGGIWFPGAAFSPSREIPIPYPKDSEPFPGSLLCPKGPCAFPAREKDLNLPLEMPGIPSTRELPHRALFGSMPLFSWAITNPAGHLRTPQGFQPCLESRRTHTKPARTLYGPSVPVRGFNWTEVGLDSTCRDKGSLP